MGDVPQLKTVVEPFPASAWIHYDWFPRIVTPSKEPGWCASSNTIPRKTTVLCCRHPTTKIVYMLAEGKIEEIVQWIRRNPDHCYFGRDVPSNRPDLQDRFDIPYSPVRLHTCLGWIAQVNVPIACAVYDEYTNHGANPHYELAPSAVVTILNSFIQEFDEYIGEMERPEHWAEDIEFQQSNMHVFAPQLQIYRIVHDILFKLDLGKFHLDQAMRRGRVDTRNSIATTTPLESIATYNHSLPFNGNWLAEEISFRVLMRIHEQIDLRLPRPYKVKAILDEKATGGLTFTTNLFYPRFDILHFLVRQIADHLLDYDQRRLFRIRLWLERILWMFRNGFRVDCICPDSKTSALDDLRMLSPTRESLEIKRDALCVDDEEMQQRHMVYAEYYETGYTDEFQQMPLTLQWNQTANQRLIVHYYIYATREWIETTTILMSMVAASAIKRVGTLSLLRSLPMVIFRSLQTMLVRPYRLPSI